MMNNNITEVLVKSESQLRKFTVGIPWEIKNLCVVTREKAWETLSCKVNIKGTTWKLSLSSGDEDHVRCHFTLISPQQEKLQYNARFHLQNSLGKIGYSQIGSNKMIISSESQPQMWEVLRMNSNFVNPIDDMKYNNMLMLYIEMTIVGESRIFN